MSAQPNGLPLAGVRILDLTQVWAGSKCTVILAGLGAEVIKVESPTRSDIVRGQPAVVNLDAHPDRIPGPRRYNRASTFNVLNRGKLDINLDLRSEAGLDLFKRLVAVSDVVTENFSATVMTRLGLGYDVLKSIKPDIIMLSMPGFGSTGPERDNISWADTIEAMAGFTQRTGYADGEPMYTVQAYPDPFSGVFGAAAVLTAIRHRRRTGRGQRIELAQQEALISFNAEVLLDYQMNDRILGPVGNAHPYLAPHGVYPCATENEWVSIAVRSDAEWVTLCALMGTPEWSTDPRYVVLSGRLAARAELDTHLGEWTRQHSSAALMTLLQDAHIACGQVKSVAQLANDPHLRERGAFERVTHADAGTHAYPRAVPFRLSDRGFPPAGPAPLFGEHNSRVLGGLLGLSDTEIADLAERGVISDAPAWAAAENAAR